MPQRIFEPQLWSPTCLKALSSRLWGSRAWCERNTLRLNPVNSPKKKASALPPKGPRPLRLLLPLLVAHLRCTNRGMPGIWCGNPTRRPLGGPNRPAEGRQFVRPPPQTQTLERRRTGKGHRRTLPSGLIGMPFGCKWFFPHFGQENMSQLDGHMFPRLEEQ